MMTRASAGGLKMVDYEIASQSPRMVLKEITPWAVGYNRI